MHKDDFLCLQPYKKLFVTFQKLRPRAQDKSQICIQKAISDQPNKEAMQSKTSVLTSVGKKNCKKNVCLHA